MPFILDASTTAAWAFEDETHPHARAALVRARTDRALVPRIWWYELRNVLVVNERRGRGSPERTGEFLRELDLLGIEVSEQPVESSTFELARRHRLTFYDAAYLALARERDVPLATLDAALRSAAVSESVLIIGVDVQ